jgi:hypothetical protein
MLSRLWPASTIVPRPGRTSSPRLRSRTVCCVLAGTSAQHPPGTFGSRAGWDTRGSILDWARMKASIGVTILFCCVRPLTYTRPNFHASTYYRSRPLGTHCLTTCRRPGGPFLVSQNCGRCSVLSCRSPRSSLKARGFSAIGKQYRGFRRTFSPEIPDPMIKTSRMLLVLYFASSIAAYGSFAARE